ncbi:hypothetical protein GCM10008939_23780 [Deinococcus aquiradiocola]|uniref:Uncharacterized protein n=1 Tax=Deinococcus aquiradiocola TaxID=393059 RepID=A0A917PIB4_9DEIO|nr:hypothetical protein GCM10008939_23780 [Deinococcus aquiradiocola]
MPLTSGGSGGASWWTGAAAGVDSSQGTGSDDDMRSSIVDGRARRDGRCDCRAVDGQEREMAPERACPQLEILNRFTRPTAAQITSRTTTPVPCWRPTQTDSDGIRTPRGRPSAWNDKAPCAFRERAGILQGSSS